MKSAIDTASVWKALLSLPVGTVVAWIMVVCAIVLAICGVTVKLYKLFVKYKSEKDKNDQLEKNVNEHNKQLKELDERLKTMNEEFIGQFELIKNILGEQRETKIKELRHDITVSGENALEKREITVRQWKSLHEMFDEYINKYKQNSYVESLMAKVDRDVAIIGKLDEHGNDIEEQDDIPFGCG